MPLIDGVEVSPDDAIAKGRCPETGVDLRKVNPIAWRKRLWTTLPPLDKRGDEARRRMALLDKFIADNKIRTSNMPAPEKKTGKPGELAV